MFVWCFFFQHQCLLFMILSVNFFLVSGLSVASCISCHCYLSLLSPTTPTHLFSVPLGSVVSNSFIGLCLTFFSFITLVSWALCIVHVTSSLLSLDFKIIFLCTVFEWWSCRNPWSFSVCWNPLCFICVSSCSCVSADMHERRGVQFQEALPVPSRLHRPTLPVSTTAASGSPRQPAARVPRISESRRPKAGGAHSRRAHSAHTDPLSFHSASVSSGAPLVRRYLSFALTFWTLVLVHLTPAVMFNKTLRWTSTTDYYLKSTKFKMAIMANWPLRTQEGFQHSSTDIELHFSPLVAESNLWHTPEVLMVCTISLPDAASPVCLLATYLTDHWNGFRWIQMKLLEHNH